MCLEKHMNVDCLFICLPYIWRSELLEVNTLENKNIKKMKFIVDIGYDSLYYIRALMRNSGARNRNFGL